MPYFVRKSWRNYLSNMSRNLFLSESANLILPINTSLTLIAYSLARAFVWRDSSLALMSSEAVKNTSVFRIFLKAIK